MQSLYQITNYVNKVPVIIEKLHTDTSQSLITMSNIFLPSTRVGNVKTYGAMGDGSNDDTNALQICISSNDVINIPPGEYIVTSPIVIRGSRKVIQGNSINNTIIKGIWNHGKNYPVMIINPIEYIGGSNVYSNVVSSLTLNANHDVINNTHDPGFGDGFLICSDSTVVEKVKVINAAENGISTWRYSLDDNNSNFMPLEFYGLQSRNISQLFISYSLVENCTLSGYGAGINNMSASGAYVYRCAINKCKSGLGVDYLNFEDTIYDQCQVTDCDKCGWIGGSINNIYKNCTFYNCSNGLYVDGRVGHLTIKDCDFSFIGSGNQSSCITIEDPFWHSNISVNITRNNFKRINGNVLKVLPSLSANDFISHTWNTYIHVTRPDTIWSCNVRYQNNISLDFNVISL